MLRKLMAGLIYPAVLGADIVFFILYAASASPWCAFLKEPRTYLASLLIGFFGASFVFIDPPEGRSRGNYNRWNFALDLFEAVLVIVIFKLLGLTETDPHRVTDIDLVLPFRVFAGIIAVEFVWACCQREFSKVQVWLSIVGIVVCLGSSLLSDAWRPWGLVPLWVLFFIYLCRIRNELPPVSGAATEQPRPAAEPEHRA